MLPGKLPQFTRRDPLDVNEHFMLGDKLKEHSDEFKIIYASDPANIPEEFKHLDVDFDEDIDTPYIMEPKTHTEPKHNYFVQAAINRHHKSGIRRYKRNKVTQ